MSSERPNPDELLAAIHKGEQNLSRGKLKVFLGMAAGAGKTYAMLESALRKKGNGLDVLIGYVETHDRKDTMALAAQLPALLRKKISYRGIDLEEFDLDGALLRHPLLILVDELAHTNSTGARHPKRYQDVQELLAAGIDVYTTLNVQHVESRADTIEQITGSRSLETVPDSILDEAEIELIDISPQDLLRRLDEGKIYIEERASVAVVNFFREGNLTALREMALRLAAERVGQDLHDYMRALQISGPWKAGHRLLVAISPSPHSNQLIRWTRRLADSWDCPWLAVYIEASHSLPDAEQARLTKNLDLARELGAEVTATSDTDVVHGLLRIALEKNVTQIIVGKPGRRYLFSVFKERSFLNRLIDASGNIDIHIVRASKNETTPRRPARVPPSKISWSDYALSSVVILGVGLLNFLLDRFIGYRALALHFLLAVVVLALFVGRGAVIFAAVVSALAWNYFFLPPRHTFNISSFEDGIFFGIYFVVALILGHLVARLRSQECAERRREQRTTALYLLTRDLADARGLDDILHKLVKQIQDTFGGESAILLEAGENQLSSAPHVASSLPLSTKEQAVAAWAFANGRIAGRFTDNLPAAEALHLPLGTHPQAIGVLSVRLPHETPLPLEQRDLLDAFARQAALVIDRQRLQDASEHSRLHAESERLGRTLLDSISHEIRTPIAAISSAANSIAQSNDNDLKASLLAEIQAAAERLNRLVANLLSATRLESGHLKPKLTWHDPSDLINITLSALKREVAHHKVRLDIAPHLPLVRMDISLAEQILANLLLNAVNYTPRGTEIMIRLSVSKSHLIYSVADQGPGIPPQNLPLIFDKFYRVPGSPPGGSGLGLAIVKAFVELHGGTVAASNRADGGAIFIVTFPVETQPAIPSEM